MQWLNIFYCFINYHFGFIYFLKIANWRQKGKYKNNSAIFLSPKMLQPIILETTLNFIFGLQLSSKWSPNGLLFTSKVVSIWSPMETFSSLPISSQPCYRLMLSFPISILFPPTFNCIFPSLSFDVLDNNGTFVACFLALLSDFSL